MSSSGGELRGFVFSVIFIVIFAALLSSVPVGLQGVGEEIDTIIPVNPNLVAGFVETEEYIKSNFSNNLYSYTLGDLDWTCAKAGAQFILSSKIYVIPIIWLGHWDHVKFRSADGYDRGIEITLAEILADAEDGAVRYSLIFTVSGNSGGALIFYWNATLYPDPVDAWTADALYLLHGIGIGDAATENMGTLLISLLLLQLPDVPALVNIFIVVPIWACIIYVLWYVVKEMIPFV